MQKTLLLFLLLFSFCLGAQNWMPFNPNDSIQHFVAEDSIFAPTVNYYSNPRGFNPINSLVIENRIQQGNREILVFKKGFSPLEIFPSYKYGHTSFKPQLAKGKILGDSLFLYLDSSIFTSIDSFGFKLIFPYKYVANQLWRFGKSLDFNLMATVGILDTMTINGFGIDSFAKVDFQVYNSLNQAISHPFNSSYIITKSNGLISTIDFTTLQSSWKYTKYNWGTDLIISEDQNYELSTGDEIYYYTYNSFYSSGYPLGRFIHHVKVLGDTTILNQRSISVEIKYGNFVQVPFAYTNQSTYQIQINTQDTFAIKESATIDSLAFSHFPFYSKNEIFGVSQSISPFGLVKLESPNINRFISISPIGVVNTDSIVYDVFENDYQALYWKGLGYWFEDAGFSGQSGNAGNSATEILYAHINGKTWGSKPPFVVSLDENQNPNKLQVFPNPAADLIKIKSNSSINLIQLFTIDGQMIKEYQQTQIDVRSLSSGLYFLKIYLNTGFEIKKFIKN